MLINYISDIPNKGDVIAGTKFSVLLRVYGA